MDVKCEIKGKNIWKSERYSGEKKEGEQWGMNTAIEHEPHYCVKWIYTKKDNSDKIFWQAISGNLEKTTVCEFFYFENTVHKISIFSF